MDPEMTQETLEETQQTLPGEGEDHETPEQAEIDESGVPATPAEEDQDELDLLQGQIDREDDPEKKQSLIKHRNAVNAKRRIELKEAREARLEAERKAAYERGRAEALNLQSRRQEPPADTIPAEVPAHLLPRKPKEEDYEGDWEGYQIALGEYGAEKRFIEREYRANLEREQTEKARKAQSWQTSMQQGIDKYPDFLEVIQNPSAPLTMPIWEAIADSEVSHELAYYLGKNLQEARRISQLPERAMLREIGKIESKLTAPPPTQKTKTKAPDPIKPAGGEALTPQPKKIEDMTEAEYIAFMDAKEFGKRGAG